MLDYSEKVDKRVTQNKLWVLKRYSGDPKHRLIWYSNGWKKSRHSTSNNTFTKYVPLLECSVFGSQLHYNGDRNRNIQPNTQFILNTAQLFELSLDTYWKSQDMADHSIIRHYSQFLPFCAIFFGFRTTVKNWASVCYSNYSTFSILDTKSEVRWQSWIQIWIIRLSDMIGIQIVTLILTGVFLGTLKSH